MRSLVAVLILALLVAPVSFTSANRDLLAVTILSVDRDATLVAWTPDPETISYEILRGPSPELAVSIGISRTTAFLDEAPPSVGEVWYIIRSLDTVTHGGGGARGSCVEHSGGTGVSVTTSSCV